MADENLVREIKAAGVVGECACCGGTRRLTIAGEDLAPFLLPIASLYTDPANFMPMEDLKEGEHRTLAEVLTDAWELFGDWETATKVLNACIEPYHPKHNPDQSPLDPERAAYEEELWWNGDYHEVEALRQAWADLKTALLQTNRHFPGASIERVRDALWSAESTIPRRTALFRARRAPDSGSLTAAQMGAPPAKNATGGRANPLGMPYLYLASDETAAAAEIRPHAGDAVMIAEFRLLQDLRVIDFRAVRVGSPFRWGDRLGSVLRTMPFHADLGREMSRPIPAERRGLEYIPTQYLCEWIKSQGYEGVAYSSGLSKGWNLALFDSGLAKARRPAKRRVESISVVLA